MNDECTIVFCGCGTAGYWAARALVRQPLAASRMRMIFCDRVAIRENNAITCPEYTTPGQPKCVRLAELAVRWSGVQLAADAVDSCVERFRWEDILARTGASSHRAFAVVGLDNWPSRLAIAEDLRRVCAAGAMSVPMIQVGLDRGQASIGVFGSRPCDPCPACGLASLPDGEPCVALTADRALLRGNLHAEADASGDFVRRIIDDCLMPAGLGRWVNTKTNLILIGTGRKRIDGFTRPCRKAASCLGPHGPAAAIRWNGLLEPVMNDSKP